MRISRVCLLILCAALVPLLAPREGMTQNRGDRGNRGDQGGRQRGGDQQGGQQGGRQRGAFDPARMFDFMSQGRDFIDINDMVSRSEQRGDTTARVKMDQFVKDNGITNGRLNRDQFVSYMQVRMADRAGSSGGGSGASDPRREAFDEDRAKRAFQRMDRNGDGVLSPEEASDTLKEEFSTWDKNKNGVIDFEEFKEYFKARMAYLRGDSDRGGDRGGNGPYQEEQPEEDKRPTVYHAGNLPKELPAWFAQLDKDKDGQVGLYEWKAGGYSADEFVKWDANGDGLITVEEALRYIRAQQLLAKTPNTNSEDPTSGTPGASPSLTPNAGPPITGQRPGRGNVPRTGDPTQRGNRMQRPGSDQSARPQRPQR